MTEQEINYWLTNNSPNTERLIEISLENGYTREEVAELLRDLG